MITGEVAVTGPDVLVIDDDADVRRAVDALLADAGFVCMTAVNGAQALRFARLWPPRLVVLDMHMPVMDGREFLEHRVVDPALSGIPVVVVSSEAAESSLRERVQGWLPKPVNGDELLAAILDFLAVGSAQAAQGG